MTAALPVEDAPTPLPATVRSAWSNALYAFSQKDLNGIASALDVLDGHDQQTCQAALGLTWIALSAAMTNSWAGDVIDDQWTPAPDSLAEHAAAVAADWGPLAHDLDSDTLHLLLRLAAFRLSPDANVDGADLTDLAALHVLDALAQSLLLLTTVQPIRSRDDAEALFDFFTAITALTAAA